MAYVSDFFYACFRAFQGTGSYPLPPQGLHLRMRLKASHEPFNGPCFLMASTAYCEHVGVNLHEGGVNGDMQFW